MKTCEHIYECSMGEGDPGAEIPCEVKAAAKLTYDVFYPDGSVAEEEMFLCSEHGEQYQKEQYPYMELKKVEEVKE